MANHYASETDCADCGQPDAGFRFKPTGDAICGGCIDQYEETDVERV